LSKQDTKQKETSMKSKSFARSLTGLSLSTALVCASCAKAQPGGSAVGGSQPASTGDNGKPNVVFILADNVGYGDMGPYGAGSCADARRRASTSLPA
jgi:hypothetical protein